MRYLDPKNDFIFKKVFGEHPDILLSFLNALMPLDEDQKIIELEYLPPELVPDIPELKNSIVDVRCKDNFSRQFIVEMQMFWTDSFRSRVLFNAAKAYIRQLDKGIEYRGLQPVYALSLVNDIFDDVSDQHYHHYKMVESLDPNKVLDGLQLIFVELPKFKVKNYKDKKLAVLWLRYLSDIENQSEMMNEDLLKDLMAVPEIAKALELTKESSYTRSELEAYDKYWDTIRVQRTLVADAESKGIREGMQIGKEEGIQIGKEEGSMSKALTTARKLKELGILTLDQIADATGLSVGEVERL